MKLADKIIDLRKKRGWSQENLAEQLDVSRQSVSKWESGLSVPDLDKILRMSDIFGVSTDFLLKEEMDTIENEMDDAEKKDSQWETLQQSDVWQESCQQTFSQQEAENKRVVSIEEANSYLDLSQKMSSKIALGVWLCIFSPVCLILLSGLSETKQFALSENVAGCIGVAILLVFVAIGVSILISAGMKLEKFEFLEKEEISLQDGAEDSIKKRKEDFAPIYSRRVVTGVACCILSVVPLMIAAAFEAGEMAYIGSVAILLVFVACGVWQFICGGNVWGNFAKLLQEGDYTKEKKEFNRKTGFFPGVYWCVITAAYLAVSFYSNQWDKTWLIWPVAGVMFAAIMGIMEAVMKSRKKH